jgi:hypothetical protein
MPGLSMAQAREGDQSGGEGERVPGQPSSRLTPVAPEMREAILEGRQPAEFTPPALMDVVPMEWARQLMAFDWAHREAT